jgi:uncharacterized protein YyaL (SSP411 family)
MNSITHQANNLINETSPYLLQHAYNPVNWMPWGNEALEKAKKENKPILVSIGYSACHWCHVMEHESFEDTAVANIMNEHFICIKVDREERPDIDQIYMNAVQLMTGRGGWPLNCFTTPDGAPFYGGTYFAKDQWVKILNQLKDIYKTEPDKILEYSIKLTEGVKSSELIEKQEIKSHFAINGLNEGIEKWRANFDRIQGGNNYAPKFPIPNNYEFLMHYAFQFQNQEIQEQLSLTLKKMAYGGIYDQIGGGFARYSTDKDWKIPHFEKMLYDNAQLISLYSKAYQQDKKTLYKQIVFETIQFCNRELRDKNGIYYSALDADSEGVEGKYYVWKKEELESLLSNDYELAKAYFNINSKGLWEHNNYILLRDKDNNELAKEFDLSVLEFDLKIESIKSILLNQREKRIKPGLDNKSLSSWNGLMIKALVEASLVFNNNDFLKEAIQTITFIEKTLKKSDGGVYHSYKAGISKINGFLEDYCFLIEAYLALYEATLDEEYLNKANNLCDYSIKNFYDSNSGMFFFTDKNDTKLIARKTEITDNVIPASNSSLANSLFKLGTILDNKTYMKLSDQMLSNVESQLNNYLPSNSNWAMLYLKKSNPYYQVVFVGEKSVELIHDLKTDYYPNTLTLGCRKESNIPLLSHKLINGQTTIYVCENKVCQLPVTELSEAVKQIK